MTRSGSQAAHSRPDPHDRDTLGQVLPFRRPGLASPQVPPAQSTEADIEPPDEFDQFEQDQDEVVDYRQRMVMNLIALAVVALLVATGAWLADTIADMQRDQDCVMQGRVNCAPIELPAPSLQ